MAIFYTAHEGGRVQKFPKNPAHWWAIEQLEQNISTHQYQKDEMTSDVFDDMKFPFEMRCSYLCGIRVYSVFFTLGTQLYSIWDARDKIHSRREMAIKMGIPNYFVALKEGFVDFIKNKKWLNSSQ